MTRPPIVSIVTPTLNRVDLLRRTMDSLRIQTLREFEHIVVDGGSTDGTVELLAAMEGTYPLRWISEPDTGMYNAINKGLATAQGQILAYLNSDDLYFPWTLEVVAAAFERDPSADLVFGDLLTVDDETGMQKLNWMIPFDVDYVRRIGFLAQPTVFWRRDVLETEGPFNEALRYVADCEYWMRIGARRRFRKIYEFLAVERNHPGTLRASDPAVWTELVTIRRRYAKLEGPRHDRALLRHRIRDRFWFRLFWSTILLQSLVPTPIRRGPWSRLLNAGATSIVRRRVLLMLIPRVGSRFSDRLTHPSRHWLEPRPTLQAEK